MRVLMLARASPKSQIFRSQLLLTSKFLGFKSLWRIPHEWMYFRPRRIWYKKNWICSSLRTWFDFIIWARSVSIKSETTYSSLNSANEAGLRMLLIERTFSWLSIRIIFNSRNVLNVNTLCSNAFSIFLIATKLLSLFSVLSFAATTTPYAPEPTGSMISYYPGSSNRDPRTFHARLFPAAASSVTVWFFESISFFFFN